MKPVKSIIKGIKGYVSVCVLSLFTVNAFAIDGLKISAQSTNAVLFWPSLTNETYVVQYRQTLNAADMWTTLNGNLTAASGTNATSFTDANGINYGILGTGGGTNGSITIPPLTNGVSGGSGTNSIPGTGFYRVLGVRVIGGITNGATVGDYLNIVTRPESGANYLNLEVNGQSFPDQNLLTPPFSDSNSVTFQYVDTSTLSNGGPYSLQVEGGWYVPAEANFSSGYELAYSQPISIYVTNELSYPNWEGDAGDGWASFHVQSLHPVVDWEIDIYNYYDYLYWYYGYTDTVNPIQTVTGSTTNGLIDYNWNLTDANGNVRTNLNTDPAFFTFTYTSWTGNGGLSGNSQIRPNTPSGGGSAQKPNPIINNDNWPSDGGYWVVAYQDMFRNAYDNGNLMLSQLNGWLSMASAANPVFYKTPTGGTNAQTWPIRYNAFTNTAFVNTNSYYNPGIFYDEELLNQDLHDSRARNLYVYGHGSSDFIAGLQLDELYVTPMHRYRFVWLDGCSTAKGSWDKVFHINGPGIFPPSYYQSIHKRPALFVGHTKDIPYCYTGATIRNGITYDGTIPSSIPYFRSNIVFDWWQGNASFRNALNYSLDNTPQLLPTPVISSGPDKGISYQIGNYMQIEGCDQMGWNQYNALNDLPW